MTVTRRRMMTAAAAALLARAARATAPPSFRELRVPVKGGRLYASVNGEVDGPRAPLLLVHGGPGGASWQMFPALPLDRDRAVVLYDQLDSGRSDAPGNPANWTIERFVDEIEAVRRAAGLSDFHLLGHNWGGILAARYAARRPKGLRSLILQGTPLSDRRLTASVRSLYAALPDGAGATILAHERAGTLDDPAYTAAIRVFLRRHLMRSSTRAVGEPYMAGIPFDRGDALARAMTGGRIDGFGGRLKGFDDEALLARVSVPTLLLFGQYDLMTRAAQVATARNLRTVTLKEIAGAGHMAQFDAPDAWRAAVSAFIGAHDR